MLESSILQVNVSRFSGQFKGFLFTFGICQFVCNVPRLAFLCSYSDRVH